MRPAGSSTCGLATTVGRSWSKHATWTWRDVTSEVSRLLSIAGLRLALLSGKLVAPLCSLRDAGVKDGEQISVLATLAGGAGGGGDVDAIAGLAARDVAAREIALPEVDPRWAAYAATVPAAQRVCIVMDNYPPTGKLWGKCLLCQKWWGESHAASSGHARRLRQEGFTAACDELVAGAGVVAAAVSPAPGAASLVSTEPEIRMFLPPGCTKDMAQVCFLVDSFYYMKKSKRATARVEYLPEVFAALHARFGLVCMALCSGGAQLVRPGRWSASYAELLRHAPCGLQSMVAVVCGNDVYQAWGRHEYDAAWTCAISELCSDMRAKASSVYSVVGASSRIWGYDQICGVDECAQYDAHCQRMRADFVAAGVAAVSGADELVGLELMDSIGHVGVRSLPLVTEAYSSWLGSCLSSCALGDVGGQQGEELSLALPDVAVHEAEVSDRALGYVPLERGEFGMLEGQLKMYGVCAAEPCEYDDVLTDALFWSGLSWTSIAAAVFVQLQLWRNDGWGVPFKLP